MSGCHVFDFISEIFVIPVCPVLLSDPCIIESLKHKCFLEELLFWTIKYEFPQKMVTFLLNMLPDQDYKVLYLQTCTYSLMIMNNLPTLACPKYCFILPCPRPLGSNCGCHVHSALKINTSFLLPQHPNSVSAFLFAWLTDHFYENICSALCIHHENADEKPWVGYHVQPHCTY